MLPASQTLSRGGPFGTTDPIWCLHKDLHTADGCLLGPNNPIFLGLRYGDVDEALEEAGDVEDDGSDGKISRG